MSLALLFRSRRSMMGRNTVSDHLPSTFFFTKFDGLTSVASDGRITFAYNSSLITTRQYAISAEL